MRETIDAFEDYCGLMFDHFAGQVLYWQPICEQNLLTIDRLLSPSGSLAQAFQENHHRTLAQARVFRRFHQRGYPGWIGPALNLVKVYPLTPDPEDVEAAMNMELIRNWLDLDLAVSGRYSAPAAALLTRWARCRSWSLGDGGNFKKRVGDDGFIQQLYLGHRQKRRGRKFHGSHRDEIWLQSARNL